MNENEEQNPENEKFQNAVLDTLFGQVLATQGIVSQ